MKLGNTSQTIVPVPNFFVDQKNRTLETFHIYNTKNFYTPGIKKIIKLKLNETTSSSSEKKRTKTICQTTRPIPKFSFKKNPHYYRDSDVLTTFYNLNINKNPRNFARQWMEMSKEKYIPLYYRNKYRDLKETNKTSFPDIVDMNKPKSEDKNNTRKFLTLKCCENYNNFLEYNNKQNINKLLSPDLRQELQTETKNLIDRINMNYDIKRWNDFDSRVTFNKFFQTQYSPINKVIKNSETLTEKFGKTLKLKALNLHNINPQTRKVIEKSMTNIDNNNDEFYEKVDEEKYYKTLIQNSGNHLLKLKYNNSENPKYNSTDHKFIKENKYITKKLNKTKLYSEFPSKIREEFNVKKFYKIKNLYKNNKYFGNIILKDKYGNEEDMVDKRIEEDYLKTMWKRPLHRDAFKLHE